MEDQVPEATPAPEPEATTTEVPVDPPETMKVSWGATDTDPVPTGRAIRLIRIYSNVDQQQMRVMKTADAEDCLHIYVDIPQ